jgi:glycosyltransferase involved in cell wall biosynthesis
MNQLTICVVAQNEEHNLPRLLKSVEGIADEIVVVDGGSRDRTPEIARNHDAKVYLRAFTNHADQKNYAASLASNEWIFLLDADEELTDELRQSVLEWKNGVPVFSVYEMARLTWYMGAWIHHSRWYPDWQRRIYRRDRASFFGAIHSNLRFGGKAGRLHGDLLHYSIKDIAEHKAKQDGYTTTIAKDMFDRGQRSWIVGMLLATPWSWFHHFLLGAGFLDGYRGAMISHMAARGVWLKYCKLGKLIRQANSSRQ